MNATLTRPQSLAVIVTPSTVPPPPATLGELSAIYLERVVKARSLTSQHSYRYSARNILAYFGPDLRLKDLSRRMLQEWVFSLQETKLKPQSVRQRYCFLSAAWKLADAPARAFLADCLLNQPTPPDPLEAQLAGALRDLPDQEAFLAGLEADSSAFLASIAIPIPTRKTRGGGKKWGRG